MRAHALGGLVDRLDAVVQEERLAPARQLALDRLRDQLLVVLARRRCAPGRRPSGGVSITEMSRRPASDICSVRGIGVAREREHVHPQPQLAQQLLLLHAEALLLVHDQQAEVLGPHVAGEQAVGADQDVDLALARSPSSASRVSLAERKREAISIRNG